LEYLKFVLYGLIQGLTEFIPVSSTAHLKVISLYLGIDDPGASLSATIQLGSVLAIAWYFRNDIFKFRNHSSKKFLENLLHERLLRSIFIGIVPIKIDLNYLSCKRYSRKFLEDWLLKLKISFLKYKAMARTLPSWIVADKEAPGSSIPKKRDMIFKWAVLLTGINSVNPWINPYKTNFKYSKNY